MKTHASIKHATDATERDLHGYTADLIRICGVPGLIAYHVPNEGQRAARTGAFLKRMMMVPGVADFALVLPGGRAAFLEIKTAKGRQSPEQRAFEAACRENGTPYRIARSPEEAMRALHELGAIRDLARRAQQARAA